jgi:hypothetical protein
VRLVEHRSALEKRMVDCLNDLEKRLPSNQKIIDDEFKFKLHQEELEDQLILKILDFDFLSNSPGFGPLLDENLDHCDHIEDLVEQNRILKKQLRASNDQIKDLVDQLK